MTSRRHVHTRSIRAEIFARDDGLWDVEAELVDTKARDFQLATGLREANTAIHHMRIVLTIDTAMDVVDVDARTLAMPYPGHCATIEPEYRKLIGLNLLKGFRQGVREKLGGGRGCTHLTELTDVMPTAAVQAFAGEIFKNRDRVGDDADDDANLVKPFQLDRCHALRTDGPAVARYYPRWFRPAETVPQSIPETDITADRQP